MRRDKNAPALLELVGKGRSPVQVCAPAGRGPVAVPAPAVSTERARPAAAEDAAPGGWFGPGRAVRVPVGYLVPIGVALGLLLVGAYSVGYQSRKSEELREQSNTAAQDMAALVDPLTLPPPAAAKPAPASTPPQRENRSTPMPGGGGAKAPPTGSDKVANQGRGSGVIIVKSPAEDPRQGGLNYLIAATLPPDEAEKAAAFLVSRGLEIAVVRADNASLRWVVVLQGVAAKDLGGPTAKSLEQRLQALGREYKQVMKGPTVFNDPWWKKHTK